MHADLGFRRSAGRRALQLYLHQLRPPTGALAVKPERRKWAQRSSTNAGIIKENKHWPHSQVVSSRPHWQKP